MSRIEGASTATATATPSNFEETSSDTYTVKSGDTLGKIASANGIPFKDLVAANPQIKDVNQIEVGQEINLKPQAEQKPETPTTEQPAASGMGSAIAGEARSMMDFGAGMLRRSLQSAVDTGKGLYDNFAGKEVKIAPGTPPAPKTAPGTPATPAAGAANAGASASNVQELAKVDPTKMTESEQYDHFKQLIEAGGGKFNSDPNARNIVAVRNPDSVDAKRDGAKEASGIYNDQMAVVWKDADGTPHVKTFTGNTDPNRKFADIDGRDIAYTDKDGVQHEKDGKNDAGRLTAGYREFKVSTRGGDHAGEQALRPVSDVTVERDVNHDGLFNDGVTSSAGDSILFHNGKGNYDTGSAGCQTVKKQDWPDFWKAVSEGSNQQNIGYTLVQLDTPNA